MLKDLKEE